MNEPRIIKASYSTWRPVQGRKVLQIIFEVPLEQQTEVLTMLGAPGDQWVAIALLDDKAASFNGRTSDFDSENAGSIPAAVAKPKRAFKDLPLSQQAGIRCGEAQFREFLLHKLFTTEKIGEGVLKDTATLLREEIGVSSRSSLDVYGGDAASRWQNLNAEYETRLLDQKYADVRR